MEKVKLPREVASVLDRLKQNLGSEWKRVVIGYAAATYSYSVDDTQAPIRQFVDKGGLDSVLEALVNGYEVEETPEEKVRNYYEYCSNSADDGLRCERYGIRNTLNILGIKIKGVNAE